jgi:predicted acylesterase/phospholipase RssA
MKSTWSIDGSKARRGLAAMAVMLGLSGCVAIPRASFSPADAASASPPGFSDVRFDDDSSVLIDRLRKDVRPNAADEINVLALSGGGANGAYGAGVVYGWGQTGARPDFQVVTGISAGAPVAVFSFLGRSWDERLKSLYAGASTTHLLKSRGALALLTPGLYSKAKLASLVDQYADDALIQAVAAEHAKGRRLLVATANLDTGRLIVWDMGAIAAHGGPQALALFRQVLVASASIPGLFPPSFIAVESGAQRFNEMQVDGQVISGFSAIPHAVLLARDPTAAQVRVKLYVLINGALDSRFDVTPDKAVPLVARALEIGEKAALRSELIATTDYCRRNGLGLKISQLPDGERDRPLDFSARHVRELFDDGVAAAMTGSAWRTPEQTAAIDPSGR